MGYNKYTLLYSRYILKLLNVWAPIKKGIINVKLWRDLSHVFVQNE